MATKSTTKSKKTAVKAKPVAKKTTIKAVAKPKTVQPYHVGFGLILLMICAIIAAFLLGGLVLDLCKVA